jgi:hypothetical protein
MLESVKGMADDKAPLNFFHTNIHYSSVKVWIG